MMNDKEKSTLQSRVNIILTTIIGIVAVSTAAIPLVMACVLRWEYLLIYPAALMIFLICAKLKKR